MQKTRDQARPPRTATKVDFRSGNDGMAKRPGQYTTKERLDIIEDLDAWRDTDEGRGQSVAVRVRAMPKIARCLQQEVEQGPVWVVLPDDKLKAGAACRGWPSQDLSKHQEQAQVP